MIEVGVRHHIDSDSPVSPVVHRISENTPMGLHHVGLKGHVCDLRCEPVYVKEAEDGNQ